MQLVSSFIEQPPESGNETCALSWGRIVTVYMYELIILLPHVCVW